MDVQLSFSALEPPSTGVEVKLSRSPSPKPLAPRDMSKAPERKSSLQQALPLRKPSFDSEDDDAMTSSRDDYSCTSLVKEDQELVPLAKTKTLDELSHDFRLQQHQLGLLMQELSAYKSETTKTMETHLFDRFEGIKKHEVMTQFACKWFGILLVAHAFFYYFYFVLRQGSQASVDDDEVSSSHADTVTEGMLQISIYSMAYLFVVLFDIFWHALFPDRVRCERNTDYTHVIVAAHRAHQSLESMLPTVIRNFPRERIWVADNGFHDKDAEALCGRLGVNYEFIEEGNKANALVVVARKIKRRHGDAIKNVVLLDDDTELEDDFFVRHDILADPRVGGYCVGIAINRQPPTNIWEIAIDFEYRAISHAFGARATCSTMSFLHGICAVYKLDLMIEMYSRNWTLPGGLPYGEDGYAGLDYRLAGYKLMQDNANVVLTFCPRRFFPPLNSTGRVQGYGASSLWKQRACRWFLSWPRQLPAEFWLVLTYNAGTWYGNIQYRIYFFWWLFLNCVSVAWIPYMFYVWVKHESWLLVFLLKGTLTVTGVLVAIVRIIAFPPKLRKGIHPAAPFCSPILGFANSVLRFFGFFFSLYWFIPFVRINKLRVVGDDETTSEYISDLEVGSSRPPSENPSVTEEPNETEEYYDIDLADDDDDDDDDDESPVPEIRKSWMELLSDNLARAGTSDSEGELPSLASYSTSSSSAEVVQ